MRIKDIIKEGLSWQTIGERAKADGLELIVPWYNKKIHILSLPKTVSEKLKMLAKRAGIIIDSAGMHTLKTDVIIKNPSEYNSISKKLKIALENPENFVRIALDDQKAQGYEWLTWMQERSSRFLGKDYIFQLFVPRPKIFSKEYQRKTDTGWLYEPIVESAKPILPEVSTSKRGGNKPIGAFWTSTLKKVGKSDYFTSDWVDYIESSGMTDWKHDEGFVYRVKSNAKILNLNDIHEAKNIFLNYAKMFNLDARTFTEEEIIEKFPWDLLHYHWDGIHYNGSTFPSYYENRFMYGWDAESTAWLNTDVLHYVGKVKIRP